MRNLCTALGVLALLFPVVVAHNAAKPQLTLVVYDLSALSAPGPVPTQPAGLARLSLRGDQFGPSIDYPGSTRGAEEGWGPDALAEAICELCTDESPDVSWLGSPEPTHLRVRATPDDHQLIATYLRAILMLRSARVHVAVWNASEGLKLVGTATGRLNEELIIGFTRAEPHVLHHHRSAYTADLARVATFESGMEFSLSVCHQGASLLAQGSLCERWLRSFRDAKVQSGMTVQMAEYEERAAPFVFTARSGSRTEVVLFGVTYAVEVSCDSPNGSLDATVGDRRLFMRDVSPSLARSQQAAWAFDHDFSSMQPQLSPHLAVNTASNAAAHFYEAASTHLSRDSRVRLLPADGYVCATGPAARGGSLAADWDSLVGDARALAEPRWAVFEVEMLAWQDDAGREVALLASHRFTVSAGQEADWFSVVRTQHIRGYVFPMAVPVGVREPLQSSPASGVQVRVLWDGRSVFLRAARREAVGPLQKFNTGIEGRDDIVIERQNAQYCEIYSSALMVPGQKSKSLAPFGNGSIVVEIHRIE